MQEDRPHRSRLRRRISSWANSTDQHARDLRKTYARPGQVSVAEAPDREQVTLAGTLRSVTLRPRGGVPALEAELYDGTGVVTLVWLGRRRIAGVAAGRSISVRGRIGVQENVRVIYNPRYELLP
ncbi:OB-fold nucleic acid binding domain-containing protein [Nocardioides dubius]|uniref:OB-fold nucleic acid binding domain-containing protein n=1 Tax=Nocardioides dubius TaxID=317019 RepID=A0ABN1TMV4_9ACTN